MDLFILDTSFNQINVMDTYKSLIWTERYNSYGDFEITTMMSSDLLTFIKQDYYIERRDSDRTMIIEKLLINTDVEDGNTLTVTGRSLESILLRRIVWGQKTIKGNLQNGIKTLLNENIIAPSKYQRRIPNFIFEESTDPRITSLEIDAQYTGDNLYDIINSVCVERGIGFKIVRNANNQFVFSLYAGEDRSYDQTENPYVVFSPSFENMINSNYIESKSAMKNVTLVGGEGEGSYRRYTAVGDISGLERRELFTDARDISSDINEDITEYFDFTGHPSQVYDCVWRQFRTDPLFNSASMDATAIAGRTIRITVPTYTDPYPAITPIPYYADVILESRYNQYEILQQFEPYDHGESELTEKRGSYKTYEVMLPSETTTLYVTWFSQKAIDDGVFNGSLDDFKCEMTKLSSTEYISLLYQRGKEKLSENTDIVSFEGEVEATNMFVYGKDFFIGDIVQISNEYGHETTSRILELVTSDDETGISVYPTFSTINQTEGENNEQ